MTPGAYIDAILACLGGGLDGDQKAAWLQTRYGGSNGTLTRLEAVIHGSGVYVLAEAASHVEGQIAT